MARRSIAVAADALDGATVAALADRVAQLEQRIARLERADARRQLDAVTDAALVAAIARTVGSDASIFTARDLAKRTAIDPVLRDAIGSPTTRQLAIRLALLTGQSFPIGTIHFVTRTNKGSVYEIAKHADR